jgi:phosphomannomutase
LNEAIRYADSIKSSLIIANDPDADRFACGEKVMIDGAEQWYSFSGV